MLGHSDRAGTMNDSRGQSWNSSHASRDCSPDGLKSTGGVGLFYCFALNAVFGAGCLLGHIANKAYFCSTGSQAGMCVG
jgi:hypothetical protein